MNVYDDTYSSSWHKTDRIRSFHVLKNSIALIALNWLIGFVSVSALFYWSNSASVQNTGIDLSKNGKFGSGAGELDNQQRQVNLVSSASFKPPLTKPIEEIVVGERVLAYNPEISDSERRSRIEPDFSNWLHLELEMLKPDGSTLAINLLRPDHWLEKNLDYITEDRRPISVLQTIKSDGADSGNSAQSQSHKQLVQDAKFNRTSLSLLRPIYQTILKQQVLQSLNDTPVVSLAVQMDLPELGLTDLATITRINPAGEIKSGTGQVVTATFHHSSGEVIDISFASGDDDLETIGTTSNHPFWSFDKQEFVQAGSLSIGEQVQTYFGDTKRVVNKLPRPGPEPVYNIEVHGEHTYFVGNGILVHNSKEYNQTRAGDGDDSPRRSLDEIIEAHGGRKIADDANPLAYSFPSKRAAKQAASEISGDLGRHPEKVIQSSYREPTLSWSAQQSKRVIGKHSQALDEFGNPIAGYHDHFAGHSALGETRGHVNAWGRFGNYKNNIHLFYEN